ncbi:uncharacterized protein EV422DRAFT_622237 [Fimicolochytrium jonesii]|uniref:uncharacterized protein n=1 Tax=Fimicolochytrium jonesii TaxID=1396493 RepID=UPI0022FDFB50|nr:uncharacterized protein EV422DRAFT_622237 [Fimicolochytrium jonesii]KAI8818050.1 hypothetical protein EV422DRAFT_622237 [Fimicolochytrium jonesii]
MASRPRLNADILHHLFTHFLTRRDRSVCAQVCRAWEHIATPIQWRAPTVSVSNVESIADILGLQSINHVARKFTRSVSRSRGVSRSRDLNANMGGNGRDAARARFIVNLVRRLTLRVEYTGPAWGVWRDEAKCWAEFCGRLELVIKCLGVVRDAGVLEHVHLIFNIHLGHLNHTSPMLNHLATLLDTLFTTHLALRHTSLTSQNPRPLTLHLTYNLPTAPLLQPHIHSLSSTHSTHAAHLHALTIHGEWATESDLVAVLSSAVPPPSHRRGSEFELNLVGCVVSDAVWEALVRGFNEGVFGVGDGWAGSGVGEGRRGRRQRRRMRNRSATPGSVEGSSSASSSSTTTTNTLTPPSPTSSSSSPPAHPPTRRLRLLTIASSALSNPLNATRAIEVLAACANYVRCLATPPTPRTPGGGSCAKLVPWREEEGEVGVVGMAF